MIRVHVDRLVPGMVLARPIPNPSIPGRYLLQKDQEVPLSLVPRLKQWGIYEVWIRYPQLEFLEYLFDQDLEEQQRELYHRVRCNFERTMQNTGAVLDWQGFEEAVTGLMETLHRHRFASILQKLDAYDNYLMVHSTNVCYLGMLLGVELESYLIQQRRLKDPREAKDLRQLGLGLLLHDVGKVRIDPQVLNKPGRLTPEEMEHVRQHPVLGYEMVRGNVPPSSATVVLNHHQRWDGRGYPPRVDPATGEPLAPLRETQIPVFARIATVVDVFDAATTHRCYSAAKPPVRVLHEMRTVCRGMFDPVILEAFFKLIPPFPVGKVVRLSNGMEAAVVDFNPEDPYRPKVQALRTAEGHVLHDPSLHEFDLAIYRDLYIQEVDGQDITPYLPEDFWLYTPRPQHLVEAAPSAS